ncbi:hypothetical protein DOTSEDRAFT_29775 [Dothistroma septosporum NZE10]|uniref:Uncharacterized protein n=1 Tax=Dothistroma septosporum (strain NZE10 / CBS 128990) TaxID=675120 RepID=M2YHM9_DOTSN|nr:hypothetical protein DOTSEDRAFT_29775 [Dothistroma septosporum NZE10]
MALGVSDSVDHGQISTQPLQTNFPSSLNVSNSKLRQAVGGESDASQKASFNLPSTHRLEKSSTTKKFNLLRGASLATQTQDGTELGNQTLAILVVGHDTTAGLLGLCSARLALHPTISTILNNFHHHESSTSSKVKCRRYLQHFLKAILHLHPNVPVNSRQALRDATLLTPTSGPDGKSPISVPKGRVATRRSVYTLCTAAKTSEEGTPSDSSLRDGSS